jgi:hypothetical protein
MEALLGEALLERLAFDGAKEEAVEQHVEHVAVLLRLRQRRRERLAEVLPGRPAHRVEGLEGVQQLRGAHRHALAPELVGELEQPRSNPGRAAGRRHTAV